MAVPLGSGEQVVLTFNAAVDPTLLKLNKKRAFLTNRRIIFEGKQEFSVSFSSIISVELKGWQGTGKIIEVSHGKKTLLGVIHGGGSNNEKTEILFKWLKEAAGQKEMSAELAGRIKQSSEDFRNRYSIFGTRLDISKPYSWSAAVVLFVGFIFGGAIGAGVAFMVAAYILNVGNREDYSEGKKWAVIIASISVGIVVYFVVAIAFLTFIGLIFGRRGP